MATGPVEQQAIYKNWLLTYLQNQNYLEAQKALGKIFMSSFNEGPATHINPEKARATIRIPCEEMKKTLMPHWKELLEATRALREEYKKQKAMRDFQELQDSFKPESVESEELERQMVLF